MNWMIQKLKDWHWMHTWSKWKLGPAHYMALPWAKSDEYNFIKRQESRCCEKCGRSQNHDIIE